MFADLDESIRQLLIQRGNLDSGEVDIAFDLPSREWAAGVSKPTVNLYLYDIRECNDLKNPAPWTTRPGPNNTAIKSRPDVRIDLTYCVTAFANAVEDEHRLLTRTLITLFQYPNLPPELLQGAVGGQEIRTFTAQPDGVIQSPADFWGALDNDIKPSIDYRVTLRIHLNQEIPVGLALTSQFKLGLKANGSGAVKVRELPFQIGGRIHQSGDPEQGISGASVTLLERALDATTDDTGRYTFSGVPAGSYTLVISAPGVEEERREIQVPSGSYDVSI